MNAEGDQVYVYINGDKVWADYENTTATTDFIAEAGTGIGDLDGDGTVDGQGDYDILASRVATYKALADKISDITGLNAYMVNSTTNEASTNYADVIEGVIRIDSIIPGEEFTLGDVVEVSGTTEIEGNKTTLTEAVEGTGRGAVQTAMEALKDAVAGKQYDVYSQEDIVSDDDGNLITWDTASDQITFTMTIDGIDTTVTSTSGLDYGSAVNDLISQINTDPNLSLLVEAKNVNGELVIQSKTTGEEFSGILKYYDGGTATGTEYVKEKNLELSGNTGTGAEFMQIVSTVEQETSMSSLQLKLDSLGLTDSYLGEFSVDESGLITMSQDGVDYVVGQIAIAQFANNIGLEAVGDNLLEETTESGKAIYTTNNDNSTVFESETLELSTADLSESLVNLMVFQRAFEANSKSITTADEILTTLIQLKRQLGVYYGQISRQNDVQYQYFK
eukprot:TRINITY_DN125784_c0_g1_i1.p1 TRINITY_DN125784_c0_g1~~TRINITY_DN125784_c0_g1_i1.p1  ORF type:complete len:519 (-),score=40.89 TRINITY_DN125784_c0_g1_i1:177-1520(-)